MTNPVEQLADLSPPPGFFRSAASLFSARVFSLVAMMATAIITARYLGPAGRGALAVLTALNSTFVQLGNFGVAGANVFHVARDRSIAARALSNSVLLAACAGAFCTAACLVPMYTMPRVFEGITPILIVASSAAVGPLLFIQFAQHLALGLQRVDWFNKVEIAAKAALVAYVVFALVVLRFRLLGFVFGQTLLLLAFASLVAAAFFRKTGSGFAPSAETARAMAGYGARSYTANLLSFLVLRADPFMVNYFLGAAQTGILAVASQVVDAIYLVPTAIGSILCSRVSAGTMDGQAAKRLIGRCAILFAPMFLLAGALAGPAFPLVFSAEFKGAVAPFLWLLPGAFLLSVEILFAHWFAGEGYPLFLSLVWIPALACKVVLNLLWIPRYGIVGASYSSSVTFALVFALVLAYFIWWSAQSADGRKARSPVARTLREIGRTPVSAIGPRIWRVTRRELRKRVRSRHLPSNPISISDSRFLAMFGPARDAESVLRRLASRSEGLFPVDRIELGAEDRKNALRAADGVCRHVFDLLGSGPTQLGEKINWRRDFKSGREWPLVHFSRLQIAYGDGSDIKIVRELSRFQHLVPLGQAWRATTDPRYAREFVEEVSDWLRENPVEFGPNWECPMDVALRAVSWVLAFRLFADCPDIPQRFWMDFHKSLILHGRFVMENIEWSDTNRTNHYLSDVVGLLYLGALFRETREGRRWLDCAARSLESEMLHQTYPDGVCREMSVGYHRLVTELFLSGKFVLEAEGRGVSPLFLDRLEKMLRFVRSCTRPDGKVSRVGDSDDGRAHTLTGCGRDDPNDHSHLFSDFGIQTADDDQAESEIYPHGGFCFMRAGTDVWVCVRCGPGSMSGHGHCDQLSFELFALGEPLIVDPGTYAYTADPEARNLFRSTAYHNTVRVDREEQNRFDPEDLFSMSDDARAEIALWEVSEDRVRFRGLHHGYERLRPPTTHARSIELRKEESTLVIADELDGDGEHFVEMFLHLPHGADAALDADGTARINKGVVITEVRSTVSGVLAPVIESGWVSPRYGVRLEAPVLCWRGAVRLPFRAETVITWRVEG